MGLLLLLPLFLLGGGSGSFSLNGDGDVSRYPMLMSVFHGRSGAPLSLILLFLSLSLSFSFYLLSNSSIVLSLYSFTVFCLMMKCWFWNMFLTPFFINKNPKAGLDHGEMDLGAVWDGYLPKKPRM